MRIHRIIKSTFAEGYGNRYAIWTQGCTIRCKNCLNQQALAIDGGYELTIEALLEDIRTQSDIDGLTILGGEPFDQEEELASLCYEVKKMNLSIILFSGYQLDHLLQRKTTSVKTILDSIDLLIDGPYIEELTGEHPLLAGSSNQNLIYLTDYFKHLPYASKDLVEIRISKSGHIKVNGMFKYKELSKIWEGLYEL